MTHGYRFFIRFVLPACVALVLGFLPRSTAVAQPNVKIENAFSSVFISTDQKCGKFWFATGPQFNNTRFTYRGGGTASVITSHVVFRMKVGDNYRYYCNTVPTFANGGVRPQSPTGDVPFAPYDSIYVSPNKDTAEVIWKNLGYLHIVMRFVAEPPRNQYDDGADILVEFEYEPVGGGPGVSDFGIFMMLDGDNGTLNSTIPSDRSSVLTDRGYFPSDEYGALFKKPFSQIPQWALTGWFEYTDPINETFSVHRLRGTSLGGAPLNEPDMYAIGNWKDFRGLSWNVNSDVTSKQILDVATCMRWESIGTDGLIRTAFGTSSNAGNNLFHCRDSNVFVVIRTESLVKQQELNGPYDPAEFDVEMWVSSLERSVTISPMFQLQTPIRSYPDNDRRLALSAGQVNTFAPGLAPRETKRFVWKVNVNQTSSDSLVALELYYRDTASLVSKPLVPLLQGCNPLIHFEGAYKPPPPDTRPPVVQGTGSGRDKTAWWTFRTFDRHTGFKYDTGLEKIEITRNDGNNFRLTVTPTPFVQCDTTVTVNIRAEVIDTAKTGAIVFRVFDCNGNWTEGSANYTTRPDIFKPEVVRIDSVGRFDPNEFPCAVPVFEVHLEDRNHQTPSAGDAGFGTVEVLNSMNFEPIEVNFDGDPIKEFDEYADFRLTVTDVLQPGYAVVRIADFAGNADTLRFDYCTIPDRKKPLVTVTPGPGSPVTDWAIDASDEREWDRGLAEVVEISNTNMNVTPWPVTIRSGQASVSGIAVNVVDDAFDAEITLEFRDTYYVENDPDTHAAHSERAQLTYSGIRDTIPPVIRFVRNLTVPPTEVVFDVQVEDIHTVNGEPYKYDRGLKEVTWNLTPNMRVRTPISYSPDRKSAGFEVEIVNTLAIVDGDTVCVSAVDSAGNSSERCRAWPSTPDGKSPIFTGRLSADRSTITGTVNDDREFDRGLGSVTLRSEVNLKPYSNATIGGQPSAPITLDVIDPEEPISGELVVRDLVGELDDSPEQAIHTVVIPFSLQTAQVYVQLPELVEGGSPIEAQLVAMNDFSADQVSSLSFELDYTTNVSFMSAQAGNVGGTFAATALPGNGRLGVTATTVPGRDYHSGDVLGSVRFKTGKPNAVDKFGMHLVAGSGIVNGGTESVISVRTNGDPLASELTLPAPFLRMSSDSLTVINGDCNRVLTSDQTLDRPINGMAILGIRPQPVGASAGTGIHMFVRDIPETGGRLELIAPDGTSAMKVDLASPEHDRVSEVNVTLPKGLAPGLYFIRVSGSTGTDQAKLMVVD